MGNTFKTALLLTAADAAAPGGSGALSAARTACCWPWCSPRCMNFVSYFFSDKIALATYRAQPVTREELPRVYDVVERLTQKIGIPMPKMYVIPTDSPNAFATGRNPQHASVAVTQGILDSAERRGTGRRAGPRTGTRPQSRHPDQFDRRDHRRRHHLSGAHGILGHAFRRRRTRSRRPRRMAAWARC